LTDAFACHSFPASHRINQSSNIEGAPMRQRIVTGLGIALLGIASSGHAVGAEGTSPQHQHWMRKLETPGGTLPGSPDMFMDPVDPAGLMHDGTVPQHRSWIRKLETPNGTLSLPL
jgi:hypothetical protein